VNFEETVFEDMDLVHLAQDRYQWWALVNMVMKLGVPHKAEPSKCWIHKKDSAPRRGSVCSNVNFVV
jgi:hypothetical protein